MARLVPHAKVLGWEAQLSTAIAKTVAAQRRDVFHVLGVQPTHNLTAASSKRRQRQAAAGLALSPWSSSAWRKHVDADLAAVAAAVAAAALVTAKSALPAHLTMGMPVSSVTTTKAMVDAAYAAGDSIGARVNAAVSSAPDVFAAADDADDAMDSAGAILDNVVGSMASQAASLSTTDVTSYLAGYFGHLYTGATKIWNTMEDDRVRQDHEDVDGTGVALNDVFIVGGEAMVGPGDTAASDSQTIGCRCWLDTDGVVPEGTTDDLGNSDTGGPYDADDDSGEADDLDAEGDGA